MRWAQITVGAPPDAQEAVSAALLDAGCPGVAADPSSRASITGWLPVTDALEPKLVALTARLDALPSCGLPATKGITVRYVEDVDWLTEWKRHHHATPIGSNLLICPSWEVPPPGGERKVVLLDPGMAFGTGSHPTTRLCLSYLESHPPEGLVVADVGTGSGILAIAAAKLGASRVFASEIDALPRRIAAENVAANLVSDVVIVLSSEQFEQTCPPCDLVVCNIIADTIAELAPMLARLTKLSGVLLVSGIVEERRDVAADALAAAGLVLGAELSDDVWRAMLWRRPAPSCAD